MNSCEEGRARAKKRISVCETIAPQVICLDDGRVIGTFFEQGVGKRCAASSRSQQKHVRVGGTSLYRGMLSGCDSGSEHTSVIKQGPLLSSSIEAGRSNEARPMQLPGAVRVGSMTRSATRLHEVWAEAEAQQRSARKARQGKRMAGAEGEGCAIEKLLGMDGVLTAATDPALVCWAVRAS